MAEGNVIPWPEIVEFHKKSQEHLLAAIEIYEQLSLDQKVSSEQKAAITQRINSYKFLYLGINNSK